MADPDPITYDPSTPSGRVRLLINDVDPEHPVFSDDEILTFLALEDDEIFLAAAQALDTIADNEALASKVIRTQDLATDGAKLADALRKRADSLRTQHESSGYFDIVEAPAWPFGIELAEPRVWPSY